MSQYRESTFPGVADASLNGAGRYVRVKITGAQNADLSWPVGLCGVNDVGVGVIDNQQANATGQRVNIWMNNDNKTKIMVANGAITANNFVFAAANGQIGATGSLIVGLALETAANAGDFIEVLPGLSLGNAAGGNAVPTAITANGAIAPHTPGTYVITKAGVAALTLAAPTAGTDDGLIIVVTSNTANAHTLTATGLLGTGTANVNVATFAAHVGAGVTLMAYQGVWMVLASVGITFS